MPLIMGFIKIKTMHGGAFADALTLHKGGLALITSVIFQHISKKNSFFLHKNFFLWKNLGLQIFGISKINITCAKATIVPFIEVN
jgi:hypothetical protein